MKQKMAKADIKDLLLHIHEEVPAKHYDTALKHNVFQIYWHGKRFGEVIKITEPTNGRILDVGCHAGTFTAKILQKAKTKQIYGVDISKDAIKLIKKRIPYGKFVAGDAEKLAFDSRFFDYVYCLEMLEHVDNPLVVIKEIKRVLKKGGKGIILVPTESRLFKIVWFLWTIYYPVWRHAHVQSFNNQRLEALLEYLGLKITYRKHFHFGMLKLVVFQK